MNLHAPMTTFNVSAVAQAPAAASPSTDIAQTGPTAHQAHPAHPAAPQGSQSPTPTPGGLPTAAARHFPADFVFGVATSAFQIEGAADRDGKGPSIWDTFCRQPGAIADHSNGDIACEHYDRWEADLDLIQSLGARAYRFSISWPRVRATGDGPWNEAGLAFYEKLVDGIRARGMKAYVTLNHWDLPQALQDQGGWGARATVDRFVEYAEAIGRRIGHKVASIATHNEPWVVAQLGHESGIFAPGLKDRRLAAQVSHHLLLSHGRAIRRLRALNLPATLGIVLNLSPIYPATDTPQDHAKARLEDGKLRRWYMDPLFKGHYPQDVLDDLGDDAPQIADGDLADIQQPIDFVGVNYYSRGMASADNSFDAKRSGLPLTDMGWEVYPQGLTDLLVGLHRDYPEAKRLYVTENGGAFPDALGPDGQVHDADRTSYLDSHIAAVGDAIAQGVPMGGYMVWSLLDNFEWASGYEKRFGIVHVDYATQVRTPKDSALAFRDFLRGLPPHGRPL
ncbi:GH1 family beta-glucosidase [Roseateles depolymerans]|uniref:Beta-glucosidase n=1 Tax=Roseateles depolymerans TaxID=76731 RepID=A0A0U3L7K8_9BURK|nr:GH1 family beta-glucosidase [Roseateles depolymerans]ALV07278.1 Beta-glucosidase [Roseateles depolymerans]REG20261.1 beta-glucosidase [Roseateles depolymerans]